MKGQPTTKYNYWNTFIFFLTTESAFKAELILAKLSSALIDET